MCGEKKKQKENTEEVSKGHLPIACTLPITTKILQVERMTSISESGTVNKWMKSREKQRQTQGWSWHCILSRVLLDIIQFGGIRLSWHALDELSNSPNGRARLYLCVKSHKPGKLFMIECNSIDITNYLILQRAIVSSWRATHLFNMCRNRKIGNETLGPFLHSSVVQGVNKRHKGFNLFKDCPDPLLLVLRYQTIRDLHPIV